MPRIDELDKKIIAMLQKDGRISLTDIGRKLGLSHVSIRKRIEKLYEKGVKVTAGLDARKFGFRIAIVNVEAEGHERLLELLKKFSDCPRMVFMTTTTGAYNLMTVMIAEDADTLNSIIEFCSARNQKGIRRSEAIVGEAPILPKYLPIRIMAEKKLEDAPCGVNCGRCARYKEGKCLACPATKYYRGPL